ncbi:MAG TPA: hypothetical protein VGJ43_04805 [Acidimicrobiales bacterium]|jgi:hypothetical protein
MVNLLNGLMNDAKILIIGALVIMALAFVIMTWARTRSLVPTLGAVILGGLILAAVSSYAVIKEGATKDINRYNTTTNATVDD